LCEKGRTEKDTLKKPSGRGSQREKVVCRGKRRAQMLEPSARGQGKSSEGTENRKVTLSFKGDKG